MQTNFKIGKTMDEVRKYNGKGDSELKKKNWIIVIIAATMC